MSFTTSIKFGWFCVLREDLDAYDACYDLADETGNEFYRELLASTDPITGKNAHICVFNKIVAGSHSIHLDDYTVVYTDRLPAVEITGASYKINGLLPEVPSIILQFINEFRNKYGDDSITLRYGLVVYQY
jgi:hypothetical protein